ncbi:MAG: hypothetical protein ACE5DX_00460 [Candidatus Dojkabacteria bacterium]
MSAKHKLKAFGLAEIIVALGIFGTAMIATVAIAVASLRTVKDNELADIANSVMIRSMEYMKSPAVVPDLLNLPAATNDVHSFKIMNDIDSQNTEEGIVMGNVTSTGGIQPLDDCGQASAFKVNFVDLPNLVLCNQVLINENKDGTFEIRSIIVFGTSKGLQSSELIGFRNTVGGTN